MSSPLVPQRFQIHSRNEDIEVFSIVICAYTEKRWDELISSIKSVMQQSLPPDEIILVIDHNPKLFERARDYFPSVKVIENFETRGLSGARNSGVKHASGEILGFIDEDATADRDWLARLQEGYTNHHTLGVGGAILPIWESSTPPWFPEEFLWVVGCTYRGLPEITSSIRNLIGCNMSLRRVVFEQSGLFRSNIGRIGSYPTGCEETELCIRATQYFPTGKFIYEPKAIVHHKISAMRARFQYLLSRCFAEGLSKAQVTHAVGPAMGLAAERTYTLRTLPRGFARGLADAFLRQDVW